MDSSYVIQAIYDLLGILSTILVGGFPTIMGVSMAMFALIVLIRILARFLNLPGWPSYDSSRGSYRIGRGRRLKVHSGNMLE